MRRKEARDINLEAEQENARDGVFESNFVRGKLESLLLESRGERLWVGSYILGSILSNFLLCGALLGSLCRHACRVTGTGETTARAVTLLEAHLAPLSHVEQSPFE